MIQPDILFSENNEKLNPNNNVNNFDKTHKNVNISKNTF